MKGLLRMMVVLVRTAWLRLLGWTAAIVAVVLGVARAQKQLYPTAEARLKYAQSMGISPAVVAFNGLGHDLTELGSIVAYEVGFMGQIMLPIVALHLAITLTRHEEEVGRLELIRAGRVQRLVPMVAACLALVAVTAALAAAVGTGLVLLDLPPRGSWLYALSLALFFSLFASAGLVAAQLGATARTAHGLALGVVMATYLVRALIDGRAIDAPGASPMGWLVACRPWAEVPPLWPWLTLALSALGLFAIALALQWPRDVGAGLIGPRPGPREAAPHLGTPLGVAWRLTRAGAVGWAVGTAVWGALVGTLAEQMADTVKANPTIIDMLGLGRPEHIVTRLALLVGAVGAAALAVQNIQRLAREEGDGRLGWLLSTRVPRWRHWWTWTTLTFLQASAALVVCAAATAATAWATTGNRGLAWPIMRAGLELVPAVAAVLAVAAGLLAWRAASVAAAWAVVGWSGVVGLLGDALRLPQWSRDLSPFHAIGDVPIDQASTPVMVTMAVGAVALLSAAMVRFSRRDMPIG